VHNADSPCLFDDFDAALQGGKIDFANLSKLNDLRFLRARKVDKYRDCPGRIFDSLKDRIA
jgi:hypothetical protein